MGDGVAIMSGTRFARTARLAALVLALPALLGAGPRSTATDEVARGADHGVVLALFRVAGDTIALAARDLPRGTVLRSSDIEMVVSDGENTTAAFASAASASELPAAGWVVRRLVHKGEPLRAPAVVPPVLIAAGSPVSLVWEVGELRVTRTGTAVGAAYAGETVTVRVDAKRRFTGIATAPGTVVVRQP